MVSINELKQDIQVNDVPLTQKGLEQEGAVNVDDYIQSVVQDALSQTMASGNYFPTRLDPKIYDIGTLFNITPTLTHLETKGRRKPTDTTEVKYIRLNTGFAGEWIGETADTAGDGTAITGTSTATMKVLALPISMSDLIGKGASGSSRAQLLQYAQQALREKFNEGVVKGNSAGTEEFNGINTLIVANGTRANMSGAALSIKDLNNGETVMRDVKKTAPNVVLTNNSVVDQLKEDMMATQRYVNKTETVAGVTVPAYASNTGDIPIISDPNMPSTDNQRQLSMFNDQHVFIEDFMTPAYVAKGKAKPLASDAWLVQVATMYNVAPTLSYNIYNID